MMLKKAANGDAIKVVHDQRLTPTSTRELARKVSELLSTDSCGLFHITANGDCSWFEFAREIFSITGIQSDLSPTTSEAFKSPARRPAYSVLDNARLRALGLDYLKDWRAALQEYLQNGGQADSKGHPVCQKPVLTLVAGTPKPLGLPRALEPSERTCCPLNPPKLSVVIPVYNEKKSLLEIIQRVQSVPIEKEIILVDDFSTDGTRSSARPGETRVQGFVSRKEQGKGAALRTGFQHATGEFVIVQDADLNMIQNDCPKLLQPILDGEADVVYGSLSRPPP
jgi:hypothetical protein